MLARRLPGLLPEMSETEALESAAVHSLAGGITGFRQRPFRSPHHTASAAAMVGGGGNPRPGEISLAHHGVLFLDELPEFSRPVLEALREPLGTGQVTIARALRTVEYPAAFQLVAAMNPCPCGFAGDQAEACRCTPEQVRRYQMKVSGPLLDRVDLVVSVSRAGLCDLRSRRLPAAVESSAVVRSRVLAAVAGNRRVPACSMRDWMRPDCANTVICTPMPRRCSRWPATALRSRPGRWTVPAALRVPWLIWWRRGHQPRTPRRGAQPARRPWQERGTDRRVGSTCRC